MDDNSIFGLRKPLPRCKHLKIYRRKFGYNHHIFVGESDESGCDIYHYSISLLPLLKICPPAQIKKERLEYSSYMENKNIIKLFDWNNGDRVTIVDRDDYPKNEIAENECVARAESRLGETNYSIAFNNCESYINWIFSGDNTSHEFQNSSLQTQITLIVLEECIYIGGSNLLLDLYLEILENVHDFVINKSLTKTIYFCDSNKLFSTFLKHNFECQKSECKMLNIYSENSKIGSIKVYETLSVRNCILRFCSEKPIAVINSPGPDNKVREDIFSQMYQLDSPLVSGATGIGEGLLERVPMETSPESNGCSCHCTYSRHYTNTASNSKEGYISFTKAAVVLANGQNPYMTNSQRIGSTACNGIALQTFTYLQHNYDSKNSNNKYNIAEKSRCRSRETFIEDFKRSARNALADVSIHRRVPNHSQTNFNSEPHDIRHHSCGFPSNMTIELGNCPAGNCPSDICVPEAQCLIL